MVVSEEEYTALVNRVQELSNQMDIVLNQGIVSDFDDPYAKNKYKKNSPQTTVYGPRSLPAIYRAVVTDTKDVLKMGRVQFYCPTIHDRGAGESEENLPWAMPVSPWGGFDDTGTVWVPPTGSIILIAFEGGDRICPYYLGTTWAKYRDNDTLPVDQELKRWKENKRGDGQLIGPSEHKEDQLLPPWNNESYGGIDDYTGKGEDSSASSDMRSAEEPHIFGFKTPEKHLLRLDDGAASDPKSLKGKRIVLQSSKGHVLIMKDDSQNNSKILYDNEYWDHASDNYPGGGVRDATGELTEESDTKYRQSRDSFNKHMIELDQTGVQLQSLGGHRIILDDKLEQTMSANEWNAEYVPTGLVKSKARIESITEHSIELDDDESETSCGEDTGGGGGGDEACGADAGESGGESKAERSEYNGIRIRTATGNRIFLCDHTSKSTEGGGIGGEKRGIFIDSTSNHTIQMVDEGVKTSSPRKRTGDMREPAGNPSGSKAFILIKTGWGHYIRLDDAESQSESSKQYLEIANKPGEGQNIFRMEQYGKYLVLLKCAGDRLTKVAGQYQRQVEGNDVAATQENRYEWAGKSIAMVANKYITTYAGEKVMISAGPVIDVPDTENPGSTKKKGAPMHRVLVDANRKRCPLTKWLVYTSDSACQRVYAALKDPEP